MSDAPDEIAAAEQGGRIDPRVLALLICPITRLPLEYNSAANELVSRKAGLAFPIRDGLALLTEEHARDLEDKSG